ncbi:MAG: DUF2283 domain-containing protein [Chlamydiae bacterium]|nr:DUF2283 domain-containing protein [Chlamydiota bacterium]MBI3277157.1 DUF2283 domain-containing protein [Chlamydiota bacterium]
MKINYDRQADALYIQFQKKSKISQTIKIRDGILCDIDRSGRLFGLEILDASTRLPIEELGRVTIDIPVTAA